MWAMLIHIVAIALPPYNISTIWYFLIAVLWGTVWMKEREIDTLRRCFIIRERQWVHHCGLIHTIHLDSMYKMESANLDAMREQREHACSCFCKVCDYKKEKCETDWRCAAYNEFREAMEKE